ncbi:MAG: formate--tetrahydrofolate ligase [Caldisericia bacterium]
MKQIHEIAEKIGLSRDEIEEFGKYKAKVTNSSLLKHCRTCRGKLIVVTAINPTPFGEGKTTTSIGLGDALNKLGKNPIIALREPSLGPVMGMKGGAVGGGKSTVVPSTDINLHFTGDFHAITSANNLLSACIDNRLKFDLEPKIDIRQVPWKRAMDMNDRALREIIIGLGDGNGATRDDGFLITAASEIMAVLCLSDDLTDLKKRLGKMICAYTIDDKPVTPDDLNVTGAMAALLADAIKPNLIQTLEGTPTFMHGGPFANIAHGTNSVIATKLALALGDYVVTECGFGADLGAEKFLDIVAPSKDLKPSAIVIVATVRALKYNGGVKKKFVTQPNKDAIREGFVNLKRHVENIKKYGIVPVVAINKFPNDLEEELELVRSLLGEEGVECAINTNFEAGGEGAIELAEKVVESIASGTSNYKQLYDYNQPIENKIEIIAKEIYRADGVRFTSRAKSDIRRIENLGYSGLPICMAKTQYSFSDNDKLLGAPTGFKIKIREVKVSAGAGFIVAICGDIMLMPGLSKIPRAEELDVTNDGVIIGM